MEQEEIKQYLLKKGYKSENIENAIKEKWGENNVNINIRNKEIFNKNR